MQCVKIAEANKCRGTGVVGPASEEVEADYGSADVAQHLWRDQLVFEAEERADCALDKVIDSPARCSGGLRVLRLRGMSAAAHGVGFGFWDGSRWWLWQFGLSVWMPMSRRHGCFHCLVKRACRYVFWTESQELMSAVVCD